MNRRRTESETASHPDDATAEARSAAGLDPAFCCRDHAQLLDRMTSAIDSVRHGLAEQSRLLDVLLEARDLIVEGCARTASPGDERAAVRPTPATATSRSLTEQENRILGLVGRGMSNRAIAGALRISEKTVKNHLHAIFSKMGVLSRTEAVVLAIQEGLLHVDVRRHHAGPADRTGEHPAPGQ